MIFLSFCISPGSVEALITWCRKIKHLLIAYFLGNIFAKTYQKWFTCVRVVSRQSSDVFWDTVRVSVYVCIIYLHFVCWHVQLRVSACNKRRRRRWKRESFWTTVSRDDWAGDQWTTFDVVERVCEDGVRQQSTAGNDQHRMSRWSHPCLTTRRKHLPVRGVLCTPPATHTHTHTHTHTLISRFFGVALVHRHVYDTASVTDHFVVRNLHVLQSVCVSTRQLSNEMTFDLDIWHGEHWWVILILSRSTS